MLRATGHGEAGGPWLSIGVGVNTGVVFAGSLVAESGAYEMVALGDPMNFASRLVGAAQGGELVMSEAVWSQVAGRNSDTTAYADIEGLRPASHRARRARGLSAPIAVAT